ncbi:MAG: SlyX family protein [Verrucomicrobiota bacterium]
MPNDDERQERLETRLAYLERHLEQQDRGILKQSEQLGRLLEELKQQKQQLEALSESKPLPSEKPPHY